MKLEEESMKKRVFAMLLSLAMAASFAGCSNKTPGETASAGLYVPGTYEGSGQGYGGTVTVTITVDENSITDVTVAGEGETPTVGGAAFEDLGAQIKEKGADIDGVSGATLTSNGAKEAAAAAIAAAKGESAGSEALSFTAGTYTASAAGYNADLVLDVTFSDTAVTDIKVNTSKETDHVGTSAFDIMFADIIAANGTGVDMVSGATFTGRAVKEAVNAAAEQAKVTNLSAFKANTVKHEAGTAIEDTWDVVIVGAGGAGMSAAAQAAQDGNTVLVIETNAEMGGNTLVSGGAYQSVMPYLVWDAQDPDATTGEYNGQTYDKVKNDAGRIEILQVILDWSEEPFDGTLDADHPFVAGDIKLNAVRGVHPEYLETLKTLKSQIKAYMNWAQPKLNAGAKETDLTLFSTIELHIFQTYYGGLRPNADGSEWNYGQYDLVKQFVEGGQDIKPWLTEQGGEIENDRQFTLIGCLWQRENAPLGGNVAGNNHSSKWGTYFKVPENTLLSANSKNQVMTRTTATELITEEGKVTGVKAVQYDGTPVTAHANKGVILATGGYGANIKMVQETNDYWDPAFIADNIGTTNRNSLQGDGIRMGQAVGADVVGMGWTQMMPLGWVDNGNLSRGAGENVIFINAATGKRYVDESAERDVLSKGGFENGMSKELAQELGLKYVPGIYVEVSSLVNNASMVGPDIEGRQYTWTVDQLAEKLHLDKQVIIDTITEYDNYVMGLSKDLPVEKLATQGTIGDVEMDENGNYKPETYKIDKLFVRFQAPSTHHTMGGLKVDTARRVLDTDGNAIDGLYAAGEVTGGFHAGNRLGGNAITEIIVSGRTAAMTVSSDNK
jgi:fumarate reductase flavoprotein subunit